MPEGATPVPMPRLGATMDEGVLLAWLKQEGEHVEEREPLFEVETDKAVVQVESPVAGVVERLIATVGAAVPVGEPVALVATAGAGAPAAAPFPAATVSAPAGAPAPAPAAPAPSPPPAASRSARPLPDAEATRPEVHAGPAPVVDGVRLRITPAARKAARELGVGASVLGELGRGGARITRQDVLAAAASRMAPRPAATVLPAPAPAPPGEGVRVEPTPMRRAIARAMSLSARDIPQFSVTKSVDMDPVAEACASLGRFIPEGPTITDFLIQGVARAVAEVPAMNAHVAEDGSVIRYPTLALGLATAVDGGLAVPVVRVGTDTPITEIGRLRRQAVAMARAGRALADVATFTLSNLGPFDVDRFVALVNPPQVAILAAASMRQRPVVADGAITVRRVADLTLSADHRAVDGVEAARFLAALGAYLADETRWRVF